MENLCVFLSDEDEKTVKDAYSKNEQGNYELTLKKKEDIDKIDELLGVPMLVMSSVEEEAGMDMDTIKALFRKVVAHQRAEFSQAGGCGRRTVRRYERDYH